MRLFHSSEEKLKCPYKGCKKIFDKPTIITDPLIIPRQTHYARPHCMSKLDIITQNTKITDKKATEYSIVFDSPAKCAHFSGSFNSFPSGTVPDECLIHPKALQCSARRK
jgi:hypothetical protein